MPPEILDMIISLLLPKDLERVRLVCRSLREPGGKALFSEVVICQNKDCSTRLWSIAHDDTIRCYLTSVYLSEGLLPEFDSFNAWLSVVDQVHKMTKSTRALQLHYSNYVRRLQEQTEIFKQPSAKIVAHLLAPLHFMPNICELHINVPPCRRGLGDGYYAGYLDRCLTETLCPTLMLDISRVLYVPNSVFGLLHEFKTFGAQLKVVVAEGLSWEDILSHEPSLNTLAPGLRSFTLSICEEGDSSKDEHVGILGKCIVRAPLLQELDLCLGWGDLEYQPQNILLSDLWPIVPYYQHLKRFTLSEVRAPKPKLEGFLMSHASTLRHLKLIDIDFDWTEAYEGICTGSWVDMIHFMQRNLCLTTVELIGSLSNRWTETWVSSIEWQRDDLIQYCIETYPMEESTWLRFKPWNETLRSRVEHFVIHGGTCPLDLPPGRAETDLWAYWKEIEDYSWVHTPDHSYPPEDEYEDSE